MNENFDSPRPGGEMQDWRLFGTRVDQNGKEIGVDAPDGKFYRFENGETFSQEKIEGSSGERVSMIIDKDGNKIPFDDWAKKEEK